MIKKVNEEEAQKEDLKETVKEPVAKEDIEKKKTLRRRSSMVESIKHNKLKKLVQDNNYMYGTSEGIASEYKGNKRAS